MKNIYFLGN